MGDDMIRLRVREMAEQKGMGIGKLQRRADMDIKTVRRIFHDPFTVINTLTLDKLAKALECDPRELIEPVDDPAE